MTTAIPFSRYNEEFSSLVAQTRQTLSSITSLLESCQNIDNEDVESSSSSAAAAAAAGSEEETKNTLQQKMNLATGLLNQTKDLLKQMTIESRSIKPATHGNEEVEECKKILQVAKANHANLKDDVSSMSNKVNHYLLTMSSNNNNNTSSSKRNNKRNNGINPEIKQHLLSTNNKLSNASSNIHRSKQIMADTELVAMEITEELARNRETIESAHSRVRGVGALSNQARRILVNMNRREVQQKMVVYGVGFVLVLALLFLLGFF